ncbi:PaaI family thioesterase [bacterium]|nr:PaaI family thioesterase [bacterium]
MCGEKLDNSSDPGSADVQVLPPSRHCFVCGAENERGLRSRFTACGGRVSTAFVPEPWMVGYDNVIHGGLISTMLDETAVWAAYHATGRFGVTVELTVRFRKPVLLGNVYHVEGRFVEDLGRRWIVEADIRDGEGNRLASASARIAPLSNEQSAEYGRKLAE